MSNLKFQFSIMQLLRDQSGFGWDEATQTVTANDKVWAAYLKSHPEAGQFRNKGLNDYEFLERIFLGKVATGSYAFGSNMNT